VPVNGPASDGPLQRGPTGRLRQQQPRAASPAPVFPASIQPGEFFGSPSVAQVAIAPAGIQPGETFGAPSVGTVLPAGAPSTEAFGALAVAMVLAPAGHGIEHVDNALDFGLAAFVQVFLKAAGAPAAETFGKASVARVISPAGIGSTGRLGAPAAAGPNQSLTLAGIPSADRPGAPTVIHGIVLTPPGALIHLHGWAPSIEGTFSSSANPPAVAPPTWATQTPQAPWISNPLPQNLPNFIQLAEQELIALRGQLISWVMQEFLIAIQGLFVSGQSAAAQLQAWANALGLGPLLALLDLPDVGAFATYLEQLAVQSLTNLVAQLGLGVGGSPIATLTAYLQGFAPISVITGALGQLGSDAAALEAALQQIPNQNILSAIGSGSPNLGGDLQALLQGLGVGATGLPGVSIATLQQAVGGIANMIGFQYGAPGALPNSVAANTETNAAFIANQAATKPSMLAIDPTADPVFPLAQIVGSTASQVTATQTSSLIGFIGTPDAGTKQSVAWLGFGPSTITSIVINVYSMNVTTGTITLVETSGNLAGSTAPLGGTTPQWVYWDIPSPANYILTAQGNWYAVEMTIAGTGSYTVVGLTNSWMPNHPTAFPANLGATRNPWRTVQFDAFGAGNFMAGGTTTSATVTAAHTAAPGADVFVGVFVWQGTTASGVTVSAASATYNGTAMTPINSPGEWNALFSDFGYQLCVFRAPGAGTGSPQAISFSCTGSGANIVAVDLGSVSYRNVGGVNDVNFAVGGTNALSSGSEPVGITGGMVLQMFGFSGAAGAETISAYSATQRFNHAMTGATDGALVIGDSAAVGPITFTATAGAGGFSNSIAIQLLPADAICPDAVGLTFLDISGNTVAGPLTGGWTHQAAQGADVFATVVSSAPTGTTLTATCGGVLMTQIGVEAFTGGVVAKFRLPGGGTGSPQTISTTATPTSGTVTSLVGQSVSYTNVGTVSTVTTAAGTGTPATSAATTGVFGGILLHDLGWIGTLNANVNPVGLNSTERFGRFVMVAGEAGLFIGDSSFGSKTFSDPLTGTITGWGTITTILTPQAPGDVGQVIASPVYASNVPWFALSGAAGATQYSPDLTSFPSSGTYMPPVWANRFDVIGCGAGGAGTPGENGVLGGDCGNPGGWTTVASIPRSAFISGATWTVNVPGFTGGNGGNTTIVIPGYGTITAPGGAGNIGFTGSQNGQPGGGPGNVDVNGEPYYGGAGGGSPQANGSQPGGAGAGGNASIVGSNTSAGLGAPGIAYILAYPS
jgi:hypothetical protein